MGLWFIKTIHMILIMGGEKGATFTETLKQNFCKLLKLS